MFIHTDTICHESFVVYTYKKTRTVSEKDTKEIAECIQYVVIRQTSCYLITCILNTIFPLQQKSPFENRLTEDQST